MNNAYSIAIIFLIAIIYTYFTSLFVDIILNENDSTNYYLSKEEKSEKFTYMISIAMISLVMSGVIMSQTDKYDNATIGISYASVIIIVWQLIYRWNNFDRKTKITLLGGCLVVLIGTSIFLTNKENNPILTRFGLTYYADYV
jgi:uncharacterized membrane protein